MYAYDMLLWLYGFDVGYSEFRKCKPTGRDLGYLWNTHLGTYKELRQVPLHLVSDCVLPIQEQSNIWRDAEPK